MAVKAVQTDPVRISEANESNKYQVRRADDSGRDARGGSLAAVKQGNEIVIDIDVPREISDHLSRNSPPVLAEGDARSQKPPAPPVVQLRRENAVTYLYNKAQVKQAIEELFKYYNISDPTR